MEKSKQDKLFGIIATVAIHLVVALILLFTYLKRDAEQQPLDGGNGLVKIGIVPNAEGSAETPESQAPKAASNPQQEPILTQEEPSIPLYEEQEEQETEEKRQQEQLDSTNTKVTDSFGKFASNQGESTGEGIEGSIDGNASEGATSGVGGLGYDISLAGRKLLGDLHRPDDSSRLEGTIKVEIIVDPTGKVIAARVVAGGSGTANGSTALREKCEQAARKNQFTPRSGKENQMGHILFHFTVN